MSTIKLHAITKMPMLKYRRTSHLRNYIFRRSQDPEYLDNRDIRTRRIEAPIMKVPTPQCKTSMGSVLYKGAIEWNNLDVDLT